MHPLLDSWLKRPPALFAASITPSLVLPLAVTRRDGMAGGNVVMLHATKRGAEGRLPAAGLRRVRMRVDPSDHQRALISGSMSDVCDALDALIKREQA